MAGIQELPQLEFTPEYYPNLHRFTRDRAERLAALNGAPTLPTSLPRSIISKMSWDGSQLDPCSYTWQISDAEMNDINRTCAEYACSNKALRELDKRAFRLPATLERNLAARRLDLHVGSGILLLRGLRPEQRSQRENFILFAGLASHLSEQRGRQSGKKYLVHITDLAAGSDLNKYPAPYCNRELPFHTDTGDVTAMLVFSGAANGGSGTFAAVSTVYNKLAESSPDLLAALLQPDWPFERPPDKSLGTKFYKRPVLFLNAGSGEVTPRPNGNNHVQPEMIFSRGALIRSSRGQRAPDIPKLTRIQCEALDAVHFAATETAHRIQYREGDLLLFNNRRILHGRDAFTDAAGAAAGADQVQGHSLSRRHMVRLWLKDEEMAGRPPNSALQVLWGKIFAGEEAGEEERGWPSVPDPS